MASVGHAYQLALPCSPWVCAVIGAGLFVAGGIFEWVLTTHKLLRVAATLGNGEYGDYSGDEL